MSFLALVFKNLVRQRVRTGLTVLGISIGITTVVALGVVTTSLKNTAGEILTLGGADFMVAQEGAADLSFSIVPEEDVASINARPDVERAEGALFHIANVGSNPFFFIVGRDPADLAHRPPPLVSGELWDDAATDQVLLGVDAADNLDAAVGDVVTIERRELTVTGIYQTGKLYEDGGAYVPLPVAQAMAGKSGVVTGIFVTVAAGYDPGQVADAIEDEYTNLVSISSVDEYSKVDQGIRFLDAANIAISVLAVGIGAIGVMNTMIMSVFERTREIGVLRALGWSGSRILRMIVGEALILCAIATVVGTALGVLATRAILLIEMVRNLLEPQYTVDVFIRAVIVAVVVALFGAVYPAVRAARLAPMEAIRYE